MKSPLLVLLLSLSMGSASWSQTSKPAAPPVQTSGMTNASGASKSGSDLAVVGQVITGGMGIYMAAHCTGQNYMACFLAAQCALQLIQSMQAQSGADNVNGAYTPNANLGSYTSGDPNGGAGPGDGNVSGGGNGTHTAAQTANTSGFAALQTIKGSLAKNGIAIDSTAGTVTLPNGKTVSANASPDSLKSSGLDPANVDQTLADEKRVEANLLAKATSGAGTGGFSGGGGHSYSYGSAGGGGSNSDLNSLMNNPNAGKRNPSNAKASLAGLSKKLGSENIGVKGDDIFEMVNRRYQAQDKQNAFLREK